MAKVFLSAGHGGSDPGACAYGLKEKDINLVILKACRDVLKKHGVKVVCSREKDENDPVGQEVKEANASNADIAVSFHINAGKGDGFEAFCNPKNENGVKLAELGEKHIKKLGQGSRGIKNGMHLCFIKNTNMKAVLFESFFIDNDKDNNIGDTAAEQKKLGVAYAKAILEYFDIKYEKKEEEKKTNFNTLEIAKSFNKYYAKSYTTKDELNLRYGAGKSKSKVISMPKGAKVTCYGYYTKIDDTVWLLVTYKKGTKGYIGFCSKGYLK